MARFAPVAPVRIVEKLFPSSSGDYHLLLAHDVFANADAYKAFFGKFKNFTIIMDNSVIELGGAVDLSVIKQACTTIDCSTIVLPDVLLDAQATIDNCTKALLEWPNALRDIIGDTHKTGKGFMIVPQGKTLQEWAWCAEHFANHPDINFWGIPRNLVGEIGTRRDAIRIAYALNPHRSIHLLGFSDDICDDVLCAKDRRVSGIDSAVPLRAGSLGKTMSFALEMPPRGDWWDTVEYTPKMDYNIQLYKQWIGRGL